MPARGHPLTRGRSAAQRLLVRPELLSAERRRELLDAAAARARLSSGSRLARMRRQAWPLAQTAVAATIAWTLAAKVLGHSSPFFAPVAAIMSLGVTRGQRGRRALELMLGVALGIGLGDLLVHAIGTGIWQLGLVISLAMAAAVLLGSGTLLLTEAAVSATLVATVAPTTQGFPPARLLDALTGGVVALVFSQVLFPVHPVRVVREVAESVVKELSGTLRDVAGSLESRDLESAEEALVRARRASDDWSRFEQALDVAREAAQYAPGRRRLRERFDSYDAIELPLDLIVRDAHVVARSAVRALMIGDPVPPRVTRAVGELAEVTDTLSGRLGRTDHDDEVMSGALRAAKLATSVVPRDENISVRLLVGYTQATAADVLRSLGLDRKPAHELVGRVARDAAS
jgi:uncharacterized membrane protein YgaE (UPF0421/DUF939 family)